MTNEIALLREEVKKIPDISLLQKVCTQAANEWPVKFWNNKEAKPWRCILTEKGEHYCDQCPVKKICPNPRKAWSK